MNSLNRLVLSLKTAGNNHKMIQSVKVQTNYDISVEPEQYPLMTIFPAQLRVDGKMTVYSFGVGIFDTNRNDSSNQVDALSDTASILQDILATLHYVYRDEQVDWTISGSADPVIEGKTDLVSGYMAIFEARINNNLDFCSVPSNDYDFPSIDLDILVIDGGYYNSNYITPTINGGVA